MAQHPRCHQCWNLDPVCTCEYVPLRDDPAEPTENDVVETIHRLEMMLREAAEWRWDT